MTDLPRSALVVGAVRSGVAAARALADRGSTVRLTDRRTDLGPAPAGVEVRLGEVAPAVLLDGVEVLVKSPGVPGDAPVVAAAAAAGIPVWAEVELGYRLLPDGARLVGITGTNGKTTTTELTVEMLRAAGLDARRAGNVGDALTAVAVGATPATIVVCELSSFQLEDVWTLRCSAAALLNITPDHLDRHRSMAAYTHAKLRIFERQEAGDVAVVVADDPSLADLGPLPGAARRIDVTAADADAIGFLEGRIRGDHNRRNAAAAAALARAVGAPEDALGRGLAAFAPIPHRLEPLGSIDGVSVWNDSKATNVEATVAALSAFPDGRVRILLGGSDKGADFQPLADALQARVVAAYVSGPAGARMAPLLAARGIPCRSCGRLADAFAAAIDDADAGEAVLLAPAGASFDEFGSYEERGDAFRRLAWERGAR